MCSHPSWLWFEDFSLWQQHLSKSSQWRISATIWGRHIFLSLSPFILFCHLYAIYSSSTQSSTQSYHFTTVGEGTFITGSSLKSDPSRDLAFKCMASWMAVLENGSGEVCLLGPSLVGFYKSSLVINFLNSSLLLCHVHICRAFCYSPFSI